MIKKAPFRKYDLQDREARTIVVKYDKAGKLKEMLAIGQYALNMHSKSGVLKLLAEIGLRKVILGDLGIENMHYLTNGERTRLIQELPEIKHFAEKVNTPKLG